MAFTVELYTFSKKLNSTARPSGSGSSYNCVLKDGCGIMSPVIKLDLGLTFSPDGFNYAYIPDFGRYYFVKEWFFLDRLWYCYLEEDTLATWRDNIGGQSFYILRAAYAHDGEVTDDMYPTKSKPTITRAALNDTLWYGNLSSGYFVISVICKGAATGVKYYVTNITGLQGLNNALMNSASWLQVPQDITEGGIDENLLRTLFNPFQYISSVKWYPFKPHTVAGSSSSSMNYGWWSINLSSGSVETLDTSSYAGTHLSSYFAIPKHPQAALRGKYLNAAPFTRFSVQIQPFGYIVVDPAPFIDETLMLVEIDVDTTTGRGILKILAGGTVVEMRVIDFGVEMPISQIAVDKLAQAETVITGAAAVARDTLITGAQATNVSNLINPVAGALETGASAAQTAITATHSIADGIRASIPQMETKGSRGSTAAFAETVLLITEHYLLVDEDLLNNGRPLCQIRTPASLQGYMLVRDGHVDIAGNAGEIAAVKAYLEAGFYYE